MIGEHLSGPPQLWGGIECTVNRIGDDFFDQTERSGHAARLDDLDRFAALGLRALRYPILWERVAPHGLDRADWRWADERLGRLRELGVRPIVGLCHHGSGPRGTDLLDPAFPQGLARFARAVAERYPWLDAYTPVNEPLTTARFAALYGHWYPHRRDPRAFALALLHQCQAVALAMREIRQVNPAAQLIQTEDLGKISSTPPLAYQAAFENERRWVTLDLLLGEVRPGHPLWDHLRGLGLEERALRRFNDDPCPPDILGFNYYVTGERFLDHRLDRYPPMVHGGNGRHAYADVEAVRVVGDGLIGPGPLLREAWDRYQRPLAVTEAHLACTREDQLRWLWQAWQAARGLRQEGVDVRAVTVWTLLGAYDWQSLLTRIEGRYEPGPFDVRSPAPRPTALAGLAADLARDQPPSHPLARDPGWWQRPERLLYPPAERAEGEGPVAPPPSRAPGEARPLLVVGAGSRLGREVVRLCAERGIACLPATGWGQRGPGPRQLAAQLDQHRPWAVVDARGDGSIGGASRRGAPTQIHPHGHGSDLGADVGGAAILASACAARAIPLLIVSSDLVFAGDAAAPYVESDPIAPATDAGRRAAALEAAVRGAYPEALVVRAGPLFGAPEADDPLAVALRACADGQPFAAADDTVVTPTYLPHFVQTALDLLIDGERGTWHLATPDAVTWAELARRAAALAGLETKWIVGRPLRSLTRVAPWPAFSALGSERGWLMPDLADALSDYLRDAERSPRRRRAA